MNYSGCQLGHYQIDRLLGSGGYADVYEAWDLHLGRRVAIKVLRAQFTQREQVAFLREARLLDGMDHPNIVRVIEFDIDNGIPYLVMPYISNGSLRQRHPVGARVPADTVMHYVQQIADALAYIHDRGFVHQDIKPENLLLGEDDQVLLTDFGIVSLIRNMGSRGNREVVGTVKYVAPERFFNEVLPASDQYSLAALVYEWLTGDTLFHGSTNAILWQHVNTSPSTRLEVSGIQPAVREVLSRALAKNPDERFENIQEFARALRQALDDGRERTWNRVTFIFAPVLFTSIACVSGLHAVGIGSDTVIPIGILYLLLLPVLISLLSKSRLALKIAAGNIAIALLLLLIVHSFTIYWLILLALVFFYSLAGCIISLIWYFHGN